MSEPVPPLALEQINIVVRDMEKSLAFYRLLGVSIQGTPAPEWAEWARPEDAFWGARYAIVEDPDGNSIGVMSPIDPSRRRPPPPPPRS